MRRLLRRRCFTVLAGTLGLLLLLINVAYLTSLSPGSDLDVDLLEDGIVQARRNLARPSSERGLARGLTSERGQARGPVNGSSCAGDALRVPSDDPVAEPRAVIYVGGTLRLTILTERTLRIEQRRASEAFDDRATFAIVNRRLQLPSFHAEMTSKCELLAASALCLVVSTARLRLELSAPANATERQLLPREDGGFTAGWPPPRLGKDALRVRVRLNGQRTSEWWPGKRNPRQLPGTVRTLDKADGPTELRCDALGASLRSGAENDAHCAMGVISRDGWALLDDTSTGRFDGASARGGWDWAAPLEPSRLAADRASRSADGDPRCEQWARSGECERNAAFMRSSCEAACSRAVARAAEEAAESSGESPARLDWYLFGAGLDFASALRDLSALSGPQPIPPRYAFGVWFSRWWPWSDWEAEALLREFDERGVPCDVLITDMDWHRTCYRRTYGNESEKSMDASHNWPCWSGFSFDKKYFAEPASFLGWCKAAGVHNGFNLHFQSGFVKAEEEPDTWRNLANALRLPATAEFAAFDPLNITYSTHFHSHVLAPLERTGVDFWWLDWQQGEGQFAGSDTPEVNPTWWLNYVYATQPDGRDETNALPPPNGRVAAHARPTHKRRRRLIMHRYGGLGNQRYPIGFSGDVTASWASLAFQPHFTASAANVNFGYWSHDVGGFYEPVEGELYVRWVQAGALSPILRAHGFRATNVERRFWLFGDRYFVAMRAAMRLRLELLPHLYTAARDAYDGGPSPVRPLYHEWPELDAAYEFPGEYVFGRSLVVSPVTRRSDPDAPLARGVPLWVPPGLWVLTHSGLSLEGPRSLRPSLALDEIPILARAGAVIFGQPGVEAEWEHCSAGARGWLGRAQRVPMCPQAAVWLPPSEGAGAGESGSGELYEDDGWSDAYSREAVRGEHTSWTSLSWKYADGGRELRMTVGASRGCLLHAGGASTEPRLPKPTNAYGDGVGGARRSWRLLLHGMPPPVAASLSSASGGGPSAVRFADPPTAERLRRSGARDSHLWFFDAERLCVVVWLFDVPASASTELVFTLDARAARQASRVLSPRVERRRDLGGDATAALLAMRRAQTAKGLLDATYPDTQPQDYDQVTWLAGLGSRLASRPSNFTNEMAAVPATLAAARAQLRAEPARRAKTDINRERVRNATALVEETGVAAAPSAP